MSTPSDTARKLSTNQVRSDFLEFFRGKAHTIVPSAPLVPANDPTLLFTNSGMVQFKNVFLGSEKPGYVRAADVQRCLRAGGKHNDLDQVGYTARHHTFFEMLGNWSFGDYFKEEAIQWSWELLTGVWKLDPQRLTVTVYHDDDEAYAIWRERIGVPAERIIRIGDNKGAPYASDNFWQMADTGPCGPCTEIFYDHGAQIPGGPPGSPDEDGDRFIEIWNLVFMQFDRQPDGTLVPLPAPCVDTGMGLERIAAVLQGVHGNYEIDLFQHLIAAAGRLTATADLDNKSLRVIADHIRACAFLVVDGVLPSNEGRGYVLRRIIRRAVRHGYKLGAAEVFFYQMVEPLIDVMGEAYPALLESRDFVEKVLLREEQKFRETLGRGMHLVERMLHPRGPVMKQLSKERSLEDYGLQLSSSNGLYLDGVFDGPRGGGLGAEVGVRVATSSDRALHELRELSHLLQELVENGEENYRELIFVVFGVSEDELAQLKAFAMLQASPTVTIRDMNWEDLLPYRILPGEAVFKLYDTYGFPADLTADVCREHGFTPDINKFNQLLDEQKGRGREAGKFGNATSLPAELAAQLPATAFLGYDKLTEGGLEVLALLRDGAPVERLEAGEAGVVILDRTPFYAESGGQVGDAGELDEAGTRFVVEDTLKFAGQFHGHVGRLQAGTLRRGDRILGAVDAARRQATVLNHSATHLLHAALRAVLGEHVTQKGSLVAPDRLRFDFAHFQPVTAGELAEIERRVNAEIRGNHAAEVRHMGMQEALDFGALALFGEKYGDEVRVLRMGEASTELCGGTHVARTGDIGLFKIVSEGGVSAGVRRIEALTGQGALDHVALEEARLGEAAGLLGGQAADVGDKLRALIERQKKLERELEALKAKAAAGATSDLAGSAVEIRGIRVVSERLEGFDAKALREAVDRLKQQLGDAVIVLAGAAGGKAALVAGVSGSAAGRVKAGELIGFVAGQINGKGGGRADMAQGGGDDAPQLGTVLAGVPAWVEQRLS